MKIEFDGETGVLYVELAEGEVDRTEDLAEGVFADYDAEGRVLGFEAISLKAFEDFLEDRDLPTSVVAWLRDESELRRVLLRSGRA